MKKTIAAAVIFVTFFSQSLFAKSLHFTVTADQRQKTEGFKEVCRSIKDICQGEGAFHVTVGDISPGIAANRQVIDECFGPSAVWYPIIGNHEADNPSAMEWLRNEYDNGQGIRIPLKNFTNQDGPKGTVRTNYSWDCGNAHFICLNEYWDGKENEGSGKSLSGSDTKKKGEVVAELINWLENDLKKSEKPFIFVFGHEPAFAYNRHVGGSLDKNKGQRDAFWMLLETYGVTAYICGHTHYYSAHEGNDKGAGIVWQLNAGNAGLDNGDGNTFFDIIVHDNTAKVDVYRDLKKGPFRKTETIQLVPRNGIWSSNPAQNTIQR